MSTQKLNWIGIGVALAASCVVSAARADVPVGTGFTYQGRVKQNGVLISGRADFRFRLYDAESAGIQIGQAVITFPDLGQPSLNNVDKGLFTAQVDFGEGAFDGNARWIEVAVRYPSNPPAGNAGFIAVSPRQPLNPTLYSLWPWRPTPGADNNIYYIDGDVAVGTVSTPVNAAARFIVEEPTRHGLIARTQGTTFFDNSIGQIGWANGVVGWASNTGANTNCAGVLGKADGGQGTGVWGSATSANGVGIGVRGDTNSPNGWAGYFDDRCYFGGNVGIGTTNPGYSLSIGNPSASDATIGLESVSSSRILFYAPGQVKWTMGRFPNIGAVDDFKITHHTNASNDPSFIIRDSDQFVGIGTNTPVTRLQVNGCVTATNISCPSDVRLKEDIQVLDGALRSILNMRGVSFQWRTKHFSDRRSDDSRDIGFVAQEMEKVLPQIVIHGSDGYLGLDYARLTPVLVEAVKELHGIVQSKDAVIAQQQTQLETHEQQISDLSTRVAEMETVLKQMALELKKAKVNHE